LKERGQKTSRIARAPAPTRTTAASTSQVPLIQTLQHSLGNRNLLHLRERLNTSPSHEREADRFADGAVATGERFEGKMHVHADSKAARAAREFNASAFTIGQEVYFGEGQYQPETAPGRRLIAHEYAHVKQQQSLPHPVIQFRKLTAEEEAEKERIAKLDADYRNAIRIQDWPNAALLLLRYMPEHIRSRVSDLGHERRIQMYAAALKAMPGFHERVTKSIADIDAEAERVGLLTFNYNEAVAAQSWTRAAEELSKFNPTDIRLKLEALSPSDFQSIRSEAVGHFERVVTGAGAVIGARALRAAVTRIRQIDPATDPELAGQAIAQAMQDINLADVQNLQTVISAIAVKFGTRGGPVLAAFFTNLEKFSAAAAGNVDRTVALLQVGPRGAYKQYAPGVLLPVLSQPARHLVPAVEAMQNLFAGAKAFLNGLIDGLSGSIDAEHREKLIVRLIESDLLTAVFPVVFAAGALVGVVEDVVDAVKGIYHLITNLSEFLSALRVLFNALMSSDSADIAGAVGREMGREYGTRISTMAEENIFHFTFDLGRMVGPTIIYIILTFVGVPEVAAAALVERLLPILRPLLEKFPALLRMAEKLAVGLRERAAGTVVGKLQAARKAAAIGTVEAGIQTVLARISTELGAETFTTLQAAIDKNLATEGLSIARVIAALPADSQEFRALYEIAYNGINNKEIWESVLKDVAREAQSVAGPPFSHPEIKSQYTQAIWNLAEARAKRATIIPRPAPIRVVGQETGGFFEENVPFGKRFYDVQVGSEHGLSAHMLQDLVVDRAFAQSGRYLDAERFRGMIGQFTRPGPTGGPLRQQLWNALYDSQTGLNSPENVTALARRIFGPSGVD
jgi:hypothetical protein